MLIAVLQSSSAPQSPKSDLSGNLKAAAFTIRITLEKALLLPLSLHHLFEYEIKLLYLCLESWSRRREINVRDSNSPYLQLWTAFVTDFKSWSRAMKNSAGVRTELGGVICRALRTSLFDFWIRLAVSRGPFAVVSGEGAGCFSGFSGSCATVT